MPRERTTQRPSNLSQTQKSFLEDFVLAINAHKMAPSMGQWLQVRVWDTPTKGLLWLAGPVKISRPKKIFQGSVRACSSKAMTVRSGTSLTGAITGTRTHRFPATGRCREIEATRARKPAASDICPGIACFDQLSVLACIQNYGCA